MNSKKITDILKQAKNERRGGTPHDVWVKRNREILLMQVRNSTTESAKSDVMSVAGHLFSVFFPTEGLLMLGRAVAAFVLVVGTVFGGGLVSAQVYSDALPGQMLYRIKLAVERTQLMLAPNDDYRSRLHTEFASNRMDEVADLAEASPADHAHVPEALARFDVEILALQEGLEKIKASEPGHVVEVAKLMERKMAVYQNMLRKSAATLPASVQPAIARSRDLVDGATIAAIAVIVEKHLAGASDASRAVVVNKFEERIRQAEAKIDGPGYAELPSSPAKDAKTAKAKEAIAQVKQLIKEEHYQAALTKIAEVAELTKDVEEEKPAEEPVVDPVIPAEEPVIASEAKQSQPTETATTP